MLSARQAIVTLPGILTSMLPFFTFLYVRRSDTGYTLTRDHWDKEYDYIIGEYELEPPCHVSLTAGDV